VGHDGQLVRVVEIHVIFPGHWGLFLYFSMPGNGLADIFRGTGTVIEEIFLLFFKKNAEQSENNVEFLKFRKYNTLQS
jgi:hypothetical protein